MSITDLREILSEEVRVIDLVKYFMRGSWKGDVFKPNMANLVLTADM